MNIDQIQVSLPGSLKDFIEAEAVAGSFRTPDDYIAALVATERRRSVIQHRNETNTLRSEGEADVESINDLEKQRRLEELLLEGINSGPPIEVNDEFWRELRAEVIERHRKASGR